MSTMMPMTLFTPGTSSVMVTVSILKLSAETWVIPTSAALLVVGWRCPKTLPAKMFVETPSAVPSESVAVKTTLLSTSLSTLVGTARPYTSRQVPLPLSFESLGLKMWQTTGGSTYRTGSKAHSMLNSMLIPPVLSGACMSAHCRIQV